MSAAGWLALTFIAVFSYLDWITHRELATTIVLAAIAVGLILFWQPLLVRLNLTEAAAAIPPRAKPILAALPGLVYFLWRGQGTSQAGGTVFFSMVVVVGVSVAFGPAIDRRLKPLYNARNRFLPRPLRTALAIIVPILIAFLIIHGSLADLPALFGGTTHHHQSPYRHGGRFFVGTILSAAVAWTLLREAQPSQARTTPVPAAEWQPTRVIPDGGVTAWAQPSSSARNMRLDGGLPVMVVSQEDGWVQLRSQNGWTGWVLAQSFPPEAGTR